MARPILTVNIISKRHKRSNGYSVLTGNELKTMLAKAFAEDTVDNVNELFQRGSGKIPRTVKKNPVIKVSREIRRNKRTNFTMDNGTVNSSMESTAPDIEKKYQLIANMFFRIVARTPYDEDYKYTVPNNHGNGNQFRYVTNKDGKREMMPYVPYVREHKKDDVVSRNEWKLVLQNDDGTEVSFFSTDFKVSYEEVTNETAYKTISKKLKDSNKGKDGAKNFQLAYITNDNPYIDVLEYGKYSKKAIPTEQRKGKKRFHGAMNGYSVQAPRGMVRLTQSEFREAEALAKKKRRQVTLSDVTFNMEIPDDANDILAEAMSGITTFVSEKDILETFLKNLHAIPLRTKTTNEIRNKYIEIARRKLIEEDKDFFNKLKKEVAIEEKKEQEELKKEEEEKAKTKALKAVIKTPKQHTESVLIRKPINTFNDFMKESERHPVYGKVYLGRNIGWLSCKIDKQTVYLTENASDAEIRNGAISGFTLAKEYIDRFSKFNEKSFLKNLEDYFRSIV